MYKTYKFEKPKTPGRLLLVYPVHKKFGRSPEERGGE
jgi:hypothetical protein